MGFFDQYPLFYETSRTGIHPNRLNSRHRALIESNVDIIDGARVLDIASHDGRWSFAALKAGARHVMGVEGRPDLIDKARENLQSYSVSSDQCEFMAGDVHEVIATIQPGLFDVVFCFGFLYHTAEQHSLLAHIRRLEPKHLIVDTAVLVADDALIKLRLDDPNRQSDAIERRRDGPGPVVVGLPSRSAVELMLYSSGFEYVYYDWFANHKGDWDGLEDYVDGTRVTLRARAVTRPPSSGRQGFDRPRAGLVRHRPPPG